MDDVPKYGNLRASSYPHGGEHHTDKAFTTDDDALGNFLGWHLGGLFVDVEGPECGWFYHTNTSIETWRRVARALRIHGLRVANKQENPDEVEGQVRRERSERATPLPAPPVEG